MKTWLYLINPFITATNGSYRAMKKIASYTVAALTSKQADPFFASLLAAVQVPNTQYVAAYNDWLSQRGVQKSNTGSLKDLLKELSKTKIYDWDIAIQQLYRVNSPQYIALLPYRRVPFQTGSQLDKISAVKALATAIGSDAALQTIKTDVLAFYAKLTAAYDVQKGSISSTGVNSDAVEAARITIAEELYSVLGKLMDYYKVTPDKAAAYFDLQTIRNHEQTIFKHDIKAAETLLALTHTFEIDEEILLINRGSTALQFALVSSSTEPLANSVINVAANTEQTLKAQDLGKIATCRFLKVYNTSSTTSGAYTIELL